MADLAVGNEVIRPNNVEIVDLGAWNELIDVDRPCGLQGDVFELVLCDLEIGVAVDLVALDAVFVCDSWPVSASTFKYRIRCPVFLFALRLNIKPDSEKGSRFKDLTVRASVAKPTTNGGVHLGDTSLWVSAGKRVPPSLFSSPVPQDPPYRAGDRDQDTRSQRHARRGFRVPSREA